MLRVSVAMARILRFRTAIVRSALVLGVVMSCGAASAATRRSAGHAGRQPWASQIIRPSSDAVVLGRSVQAVVRGRIRSAVVPGIAGRANDHRGLPGCCDRQHPGREPALRIDAGPAIRPQYAVRTDVERQGTALVHPALVRPGSSCRRAVQRGDGTGGLRHRRRGSRRSGAPRTRRQRSRRRRHFACDPRRTRRGRSTCTPTAAFTPGATCSPCGH